MCPVTSVNSPPQEPEQKNDLSVPERSEGTEVSKMAIREGAVFWGVWGGVSPHYRAYWTTGVERGVGEILPPF